MLIYNTRGKIKNDINLVDDVPYELKLSISDKKFLHFDNCIFLPLTKNHKIDQLKSQNKPSSNFQRKLLKNQNYKDNKNSTTINLRQYG